MFGSPLRWYCVVSPRGSAVADGLSPAVVIGPCPLIGPSFGFVVAARDLAAAAGRAGPTPLELCAHAGVPPAAMNATAISQRRAWSRIKHPTNCNHCTRRLRQ